MANSASAKKNARKNEKNRLRNAARRSALKTAIKKLIASVDGGQTAQIDTLFRDVASKLGRAKSKGLIHANAASRKLSRLAKKVAAKPAA